MKKGCLFKGAIGFFALLLIGCDDSGDSTINVLDHHLEEIEERIAVIQTATPALRTRLNTLQTNDVDIAYPLVCLTVLEQFPAFIQEEVAARIFDTLYRQTIELESILETCTADISALENGTLNPSVPRYVTSSITVQNNSFQATVEWKDGSGKANETWPVIFNGYGHFDSVIRDIELMPDYGCNIIQIETGPSFILPAENEVGTDAINALVAILDRAEAANVAVNLLLSPNYIPQWVFDKWPEIEKDNKIDEYINFFVDDSNTNARSLIETYLDTLIPQIMDHAALHSITLTNEPSYFNGVGDPDNSSTSFNRSSYNVWLTAKYGDITTLSQAHNTSYQSFDEVPVFYYTDKRELTPSTGSDVQLYDYFRFNDERFAGFHQWMAGEVKSHSGGLPVHVKITDNTWYEPHEGVDPEAFIELSDIAGNDSAKYYKGYDSSFIEVNDYMTQGIYFNLLRAVGGDKPIFNSENHIVEDNETRTIPSTHIRNVLWQAAIQGQAASTTWLWERTVYDEEAKKNTKASIMNRPLNVVEYGRAGLDLLRLGKEINAFQTASARMAIIYSTTSLSYNPEYIAQLYMIYEAANSTGEKIDFITETMLSQGDAASYEIVIAIGVSHLPVSVYQGLAANPPASHLLLIGDTNFRKNNLDQDYSFTLPSNSATLTNASEAFLIWQELTTILDSLSGGRPIVVRGQESDQSDAFGIAYQSVLYSGKRLVNLTNTTKTTKTITIEGLSTINRTDLITTAPVGESVTVEPMQVYLLTAD